MIPSWQLPWQLVVGSGHISIWLSHHQAHAIPFSVLDQYAKHPGQLVLELTPPLPPSMVGKVALALPAVQFIALPTVQSFLQASPLLLFPSSHSSPDSLIPLPQQLLMTLCWHPLPMVHESFVQAFPSLQSVALGPLQAPEAHTSPVVQGFPSLQVALLLA